MVDRKFGEWEHKLDVDRCQDRIANYPGLSRKDLKGMRK